MQSYRLLPIEFDYNGQSQVITPVLLTDGRERILVDCGYPGFIPYIEQSLEREGLHLGELTKVIATHHDIDHVGSLAALKRMYPNIDIVAHEMEAPYLDGSKKSQRLEQAESTLELLPKEAVPGAEQFISFLQSLEPVNVDRTVHNGEVLPYCGGIEVVHTPGHMEGHISLYLPADRTMIAGDAVVVEEGQLQIANPQYTLDLEEAVRSVRRLLTYDIETLVCYHGGVFRGDAQAALHQLLSRYT